MCVNRFLTGVIFTIWIMGTPTLGGDNGSQQQHIVRVPLTKTSYEPGGITTTNLHGNVSKLRTRRDEGVLTVVSNESDSDEDDDTDSQTDDTNWSNFNSAVDTVIPMLLKHIQSLGIEYLNLPDMKETITLSPFFLKYEAGLFLSNGIVYNIDGVSRYGDAHMTYENKTFVVKFHLLMDTVQFEYNFLIKLMALEGFGKVIGSLDDTIVYGELAVNISNFHLKLNDFRILQFDNIRVQLDHVRLIRELTGLILTPITNLFKDRITTSIADGLKGQMQTIMDDFNNEDPLKLKGFTNQMLGGLTGKPKEPEAET